MGWPTPNQGDAIMAAILKLIYVSPDISTASSETLNRWAKISLLVSRCCGSLQICQVIPAVVLYEELCFLSRLKSENNGYVSPSLSAQHVATVEFDNMLSLVIWVNVSPSLRPYKSIIAMYFTHKYPVKGWWLNPRRRQAIYVAARDIIITYWDFL